MAETNEDPVADDTGEDHMVETGEDFAAGTGNTPAAETGNAFVVETGEDSAAGPGKILPWRKSGRINRRRLFEKVFGKRLCFHCQSAPRQILEERHSESGRLCQIGLLGVCGVSRENERSLLQPFQTRFDVNRKSGGEVRRRQGIGFKRTGPGTMGRCRNLWREFRLSRPSQRRF